MLAICILMVPGCIQHVPSPDEGWWEQKTRCPIEEDSDGCTTALASVEAAYSLPDGHKCIKGWPEAAEGENYSLYMVRDENTNEYSHLVKVGVPVDHLVGVMEPTIENKRIGPHVWTLDGPTAWVPQPGVVWWEQEWVDQAFFIITVAYETDVPFLKDSSTRVVYEEPGGDDPRHRVHLGFDNGNTTYWFGGPTADYFHHTSEGDISIQMTVHGWGGDTYTGRPFMTPLGPPAPTGAEAYFEESDCPGA